jgi:hypothetical protein
MLEQELIASDHIRNYYIGAIILILTIQYIKGYT